MLLFTLIYYVLSLAANQLLYSYGCWFSQH